MNIFVTSSCPVESAHALDDKRVVKMILESVQMLATALHHHNAPLRFFPTNLNGQPYRVTHSNHPCSIWARETRSNYLWLVEHAKALAQIYTDTYNSHHRCADFLERMTEAAVHIKDGPLTEFANCSLFKDRPIHEAYRHTMLEKWKNDVRHPTWGARTKPSWACG